MQPMYKESIENKYRCRNCGGALKHPFDDFHKCIFCGTEYRIYEKNRYVNYMQLKPADATVLRACRSFSREAECFNGHDTMVKYGKRDVIAKLAESLEPYINFSEDFDEATNTYRISGTLRALEPDFRF